MGKSHLTAFLAAGLIFIVGIIGWSLYITYGGPDGRTIESREELIAEYRKTRDEKWNIVEELKAEGCIISELRNEKGNNAVAVFEPAEGERYKVQSWYDGGDRDILYFHFRADSLWYIGALYKGGSKPERAEFTYTIDGADGEESVEKDFDIAGSPIIYIKFPEETSFSYHAVFYDSNEMALGM